VVDVGPVLGMSRRDAAHWLILPSGALLLRLLDPLAAPLTERQPSLL